MESWENNASNMIEEQIVGRDVKDQLVLAAMAKVPRHLFVPSEYQTNAYLDRPLPIGCMQTISQPYIVAKMTELLHVAAGMSVLEIGTGSGYQTAILCTLGLRVYSVERIAELALEAEQRLKKLNFNATILHGDGCVGCHRYAPYDRIIVTAAASRVEAAWDAQLAVGGRLIVPVNVTTGGQRLLLREKFSDYFSNTWYDYCRFVPILGGTE